MIFGLQERSIEAAKAYEDNLEKLRRFKSYFATKYSLQEPLLNWSLVKNSTGFQLELKYRIFDIDLPLYIARHYNELEDVEFGLYDNLINDYTSTGK